MLKKPLFSPTQPQRAETRPSPAAFPHRSEPQRTEEATGVKVTIRSHVIKASGSSEAWYVPPRPFTCCGLAGRPFWASRAISFRSPA